MAEGYGQGSNSMFIKVSKERMVFNSLLPRFTFLMSELWKHERKITWPLESAAIKKCMSFTLDHSGLDRCYHPNPYFIKEETRVYAFTTETPPWPHGYCHGSSVIKWWLLILVSFLDCLQHYCVFLFFFHNKAAFVFFCFICFHGLKCKLFIGEWC